MKVEFDEEFSGTPAEGTGEETLTPSAPVNKGPKPKREKKEPGKALECFRACLCVREKRKDYRVCLESTDFDLFIYF